MNELSAVEPLAAIRAAVLKGTKSQEAINKKPNRKKTVKAKAAPKPQLTKKTENLKQTGRPRAKQDLLIQMLQSKGGATIDAIVKATDWQPHSARAMISGLRKAGFEIELGRNKDDEALYRIVAGPRRKGK